MAFLIVEDDPLLADVLRTAVAGLELRPVVAATLGEADPDVDEKRIDRVRKTGAGVLRRPFTIQDFERAFAVQLGVVDEPSDGPPPQLRPQRRRPERFDS
jgi:hypothetical protein